eukprot:TRINITY_DN4168_c0_g2_i1.p2 TRINITY_DN4168_c0_g2~~TRINITY_DN4168_c0_g2_i1.p2  ORF type:complete len:107 (+),score=19.11 TRINITY_DN4168_c0_g2_i1:463-783(+)
MCPTDLSNFTTDTLVMMEEKSKETVATLMDIKSISHNLVSTMTDYDQKMSLAQMVDDFIKGTVALVKTIKSILSGALETSAFSNSLKPLLRSSLLLKKSLTDTQFV